MNLLALETSSPNGSLAFKHNEELSTLEWSRSTTNSGHADKNKGSHSEVVTEKIFDFLNEKQIELSEINQFAVTLGPGSFTGLRVGMNVIKTLAYSFKKPVYVANTLAVLAEGVDEKSLPVLPMINAFKNMVFIAKFENQSGVWCETLAPVAVPIEKIDTFFESPAQVLGSGWDAYKSLLSTKVIDNAKPAKSRTEFPHAESLVRLVERKSSSVQTKEWNSLQPLYIRASAAEEKFAK